MNDVSRASEYATLLLASLIQEGVRDVVVCPGSRSQALALAAADAERFGAIRLHVRTDERSAAFFALGIARETGVPAPIIVTSGSAVANLVPAAIEAHESRVPMLLLTADRPASMRGTRSNQTTRQANLIAEFSRLSLDIDVDAASELVVGVPNWHGALTVGSHSMAAAYGGVHHEPAGPVQINLQFREPLSGATGHTDEQYERAFTESARVRDEAYVANQGRTPTHTPGRNVPVRGQSYTFLPDETHYSLEGDALTVVIAGEGAGPKAEQFAHEAGVPLLAEVVSGVRYGREAITGYATLIDDPNIGGLIERAVVFGHPTLTRQIPALLKRDDVEVIVIDPHRGDDVDLYNPSGNVRHVFDIQIGADYDPTLMRRWLGRWVMADRELRAERSTVHEPDLESAKAIGYKERNAYARAELAASKEPVSRAMLAESLWRASWPHDRLFVAASRLVRELDRVAAPRKVEVRANRGLAGIDGTVATALGVAAASQALDQPQLGAGTTRVLIGDLAMLHDAGSLLLPEGEPHPRIQLFVGNDGGGTIFDTLEAAQSAEAAAFERVMFTPQSVDLAALAAAYGWEYRRVETRGELERLLTEPVHTPQIIEVPLSR